MDKHTVIHTRKQVSITVNRSLSLAVYLISARVVVCLLQQKRIDNAIKAETADEFHDDDLDDDDYVDYDVN